MLKIYDLKTEYRKEPLGIDNKFPRLSWKMKSDKNNVLQQNYRIQAYSDENGKHLIWDSGVVETDRSQQVIWEGNPLNSRERVWWKVQVAAGDENAESRLTFFEMGLLNEKDWSAKWIEPESGVEIDKAKPSPYLRREFKVGPGLVRARIYQSAHGLYEFWLNGICGTEDKFKPGFTSYYHRLQYQVYDITDLLKEGENCWSVILGDGWWRGLVGGTQFNNFGYHLAYIGQIELEYQDGKHEVIGTDTQFTTATGGLRKADMMRGETYDSTKEPSGWKMPGFDDSAWNRVHEGAEGHEDLSTLIASSSVPVREKEHFFPVILQTPDGNTVLDFGQNIAGYVTMNVSALKPGQKITLVYGEALDENGNFTQKNFSMTEFAVNSQTTHYIASGIPAETYQPLFSIFGFRYVLVQGMDAPVDPKLFEGIAVYSDMEETGTFSCSNPLINQLVSNCIWSQKGNFMDVPTDCPTRERSPWTGDAQVYARTATDFMNVYPFFEKWMLDFNFEQLPSGKIPNTVPTTNGIRHNIVEQARIEKIVEAIKDPTEKEMQQMMMGTRENGSAIDGSAGWGDAAVIIPYTMYLCYGDRQILKNQYNSAKKWVDYIVRQSDGVNPVYAKEPYAADAEDAKYVWDVGYHWGEWLEADGDGYDDLMGLMENLFTYPDYITATLYYFYSSKMLAEIAAILEKKEDEEKYAQIARNVKRVFNKYFIREDGMILEGRQAPNVRALAFGIVEAEKEEKVASYLNQIVVAAGYKLNTGFLATPFLLHVLADYGYPDTAFRVLEQTESPSWLKPVKDGATTIMENWTAYEKCDASYNHYSYGAVCDFLFSSIAGIRPIIGAPGYKKFQIIPSAGGSLNEAEAIYESAYGKIASSWKKDGNEMHYCFTVPANTTAQIILHVDDPDESMCRVKKVFPKAVCKDNQISFAAGSGTWEFTII